MTAAAPAVVLRAPTGADRGRLAELTRATGRFREDEVLVALEVFDGAVALRSAERPADYEAIGAYADGALVGWVAFGATPCTAGTYDCYWIAVDPARQGEGIGAQLIAAMEARLAGRARLIVAETSGRADYTPTRAFYERRGYHAASRIPDYYAPGDDLVVYVKSLVPRRRP